VFSSRSARPSTCSSSSRRPRSPTRRATRGRRTRTEA
jgi:hypothetical protein